MLGVDVQLRDERPVDFEILHGELRQAAQRGITSSEVIDRDADASGGEAIERVRHFRQTDHQPTLRDFHIDAPIDRDDRCNGAQQPIDELAALELQRRNIDGDGNRRQPVRVPIEGVGDRKDSCPHWNLLSL